MAFRILISYFIFSAIAPWSSQLLAQPSADLTLSTSLTDSLPLEFYQLRPYPVHLRAQSAYPDSIGIDSVVVEIGTRRYVPHRRGEQFTVWWQPDSLGSYELRATAYGSDGQQAQLTRRVLARSVASDRQATVFDHDVIQFQGTNSRWLTKTVVLPQFVGSYREIEATFWTECPNVDGGCDDWDRLAWIEVQAPSGEWVELIRYITPYGRGCNHSLDLTDYASLLQGEVQMRMFIDTWGTGGWDVNLTLDYEVGLPTHPYSQVEVLWKGAIPFGDPGNLQPLDTLDVAFAPETEKAHLHFFTTGHGWGSNNSQNAAEFYPAVHELKVDDSVAYVQRLITACDPNPDGCQPQAGTWRFPRAGWCPGAIGNRYEVDLQPYLARGEVEMAYVFDPRYQDFCHPNHPDCVSGQTCADCHAGYNPFFQVSTHLIQYARSVPADTGSAVTQVRLREPLRWELHPNPAREQFFLRPQGEPIGGTALSVELRSLTGQVILSQTFASSEALRQHAFAVSHLASGWYLVQVRSEQGSSQHRLWVQP